MTDTVRTFCRICIAACGMKITVEGDQVVSIRGDETHPLTAGYLCSKGRALGEVHHSPNRLTGASIGRCDDRRAVSIDEAHADLDDTLRAIVAEHGLGSIGVFHGTGAFQDGLGSWMVRRLKKALGSYQSYSTATVDAIAKTYVAEQMAGTPLLIPTIDEERSRLLLFVGINPVVSHGHATMFSNPVERIRGARRRGPVFTLDPRTTETAKLSDHHLATRPGSDYAVLAHVIRAVLRRGIDEQTLARRATGLEALRSAVEAFDAETTCRIADLGSEQLQILVDAVVAAGRLSILTGTGSTMARSGNVTEWLVWALLVLTDSMDQPGGMWFNPGAFARLDRFEQLPAAAPTEPRSAARPDVARCAGEWPAALIPDEIESGRLRALIVVGSNLITALPDPERLTRAFEAIDALVVIEIQRTATTELATHVFACADQLERPDVLPMEMNANVVYQQYSQAVVPPRDDRPPLWQTLARIGTGVDLDVLGGNTDPLSVTTDDVLTRMARGTALADLRARGGLHVESGPVYGWIKQRLPFGCWNLAPDQLLDQLSALKTAERDPMVMIPRRPAKRMNWQHYRDGERHEAWMHPADAGAAGIADGEKVAIASESGTLTLPVHITESVTVGAVSVQHGWPDANVNTIVDRHDLDPYTGMARLSGIPVTISPSHRLSRHT
jgi:anaerobic selenocysteine-containing dehydrogenase